MKILYSGNYCGTEYQSQINKTHKYINATAQEKVEGLILEGFTKQSNVDITVISSVQVQSYPRHQKLFWPYLSQKKIGLNLIHVPFLNILILKQLTMMIASIYIALIWFLRNRSDKEKVFLSYATNLPVLLPSILLAKIFSTKSVIIVSEIPRFRMFQSQNSLLRKILLRFWISIATKIHEWFDGYVVLTEAMNEEINRLGKPSTCVEGMVSKKQIKKSLENIADKHGVNYQVFLYSGTLNKKYGIENLISAFQGIDDNNIRLWIIGTGENEEELRNLYSQDTRIEFFGRLENDYVIQLQKVADFLVNPRPTDGQFTRYSFPSKTLEYMVSGTPAITTRLSGIPSDYLQYLIFFEDESVLGMRKTLEQVLQWNKEKRHKFGKEARSFALTYKNNESQCSKIIEMLRNLIAIREDY